MRRRRRKEAASRICCLLILATLAGSSATWAGQDLDAGETQAVVVRQLVTAFNAHDAQAMGALMADEIEWFSVAGSSISVEAEGRTALVEGMAAYFADYPTVRSEVEKLAILGRYVVVRERVAWSSEAGERSQASMAVWEVVDEKVARVWYYPAEQDGEL